MDRESSVAHDEPYGCSVESTLAVMGGRWKPVILFKRLEAGVLRFGALRREVPGATQKMMTNQLRELERDGVVHYVFVSLPEAG